MPITAAKALVEEVASRHQHPAPAPAAAKQDVAPVEPAGGEADRRADHGDVVFVNSYNKNKNRGYQTHFRQHHPQHHQHQQHHHRQPVHNSNNNRRQDAKAIRFSHNNNINVDASRRNTKKLPPPPPKHFNQIGQNGVRSKPAVHQQHHQQPQQSAFSWVPNSFSAFNPFNFFDSGKPAAVPGAPRGAAVPITADKAGAKTNVNAIQTIPAPDLSKYGPGPPVIELDR